MTSAWLSWNIVERNVFKTPAWLWCEFRVSIDIIFPTLTMLTGWIPCLLVVCKPKSTRHESNKPSKIGIYFAYIVILCHFASYGIPRMFEVKNCCLWQGRDSNVKPTLQAPKPHGYNYMIQLPNQKEKSHEPTVLALKYLIRNLIHLIHLIPKDCDELFALMAPLGRPHCCHGTWCGFDVGV